MIESNTFNNKNGMSLYFSFRRTDFVQFDQVTGLMCKQAHDLFNPKMTVSSSNEIN